MTTDPFTTAALAAAEGNCGNDYDAANFVAGATWARNHLTKRIASAIAIHTEDDGHCTYCKHPDGTGEYATPAWPCPTVAALTEETNR